MFCFATLRNVISYDIRKSTRARTMRITVRKDETVTVTIPHRTSIDRGRLFAEEKMDWIESALAKLRAKRPSFSIPSPSARDFKKHKEEALVLALRKLEHHNRLYGFSWNTVTIRNTSSRWGSCSRKKNLNFSYRFIFLPEKLQDYLVVHELCHLQELNHSVNFWKLVEKAVPEYKTLRKELRGVY